MIKITVACLTEKDKDEIADLFLSTRLNIKDIARPYKVSSSTVSRVLIERGLATPVPRTKKNPSKRDSSKGSLDMAQDFFTSLYSQIKAQFTYKKESKKP